MFAASIVAYGVFVGAGNTFVPSLMNFGSIWGVRLTLAAWLAPTMGLRGVWLAMCIELCFRGAIFLVRLWSGNWIYKLRIKRYIMKYDFDTIIPRRGTNSYKWDTPEEENVLPMWVADMDFRTAPAIIDALQKRVAHGIFGYTKVPEAYYDAVVRWFDDRHRWQVDSRWFIYTSGVVPALSAIIKALAMPGDKVIVQTPAYNCFYSSIRNDGCELFANNLIYQDGRYVIDFADL